jgi:hypothetical protein
MNRRFVFGLLTAGLVGSAVAISPSQVPAQQTLKQQMAGAWTLVSINQTDKEGKPVILFGKNPRGTQVFDASGQWVQIIWDSDAPKFKVNSRIGGTPEENTAAVRATTASFGTWSVDEGSKTLTVRYAGSMFANQVGTESKRTVTLSGDELKVTNPVTASGVRSDTVWRRAK